MADSTPPPGNRGVRGTAVRGTSIPIVRCVGNIPDADGFGIGAADNCRRVASASWIKVFAMSFTKPLCPRVASIALTVVVVFGGAPWSVITADQPPAAVEPKIKVEVMDKTGRGRFVSYMAGTLTLRGNSGSLLIWNKIAETTDALLFDAAAGKFGPATAAALNRAKPEDWIQVVISKGKTTIRIGERKAQTVGTFVSFKDNRLLILGKNLGASFVQKYGNQVHFNKFRDDVPAFESVDGGEFKPVGPANKFLGTVKEGAVLTIHGEGDDNITRVEIGVPKK